MDAATFHMLTWPSELIIYICLHKIKYVHLSDTVLINGEIYF